MPKPTHDVIVSPKPVATKVTVISLLSLQINPQFYAFRWITLLLTQEFDFPACLRLWDTLLSNKDGPLVRLTALDGTYLAVFMLSSGLLN